LKQFVPEDRIILGNKKDNFGKWEIKDLADLVLKFISICVLMTAVSGKSLVNADHPQVVEIWNNVWNLIVKRMVPLKIASSARRYRNGI
jgi:alanyl-tRNA synthetase